MIRIDIGTTGTPQLDADVFARLLCHLLVDRIPSEGLEELQDALTRVYRFHLETPGPALLQFGPPQREIAARREPAVTREVPAVEDED